MKTLCFIVGFSLTLGSVALSQENDLQLKKIGIGISHAFNFLEVWDSDYPMDLNKIHFTFNVSDNFRIDPEISGGYSNNSNEFWIYAGSGFFFQKQKNKINTLYGLRTGVSFNDYSYLMIYGTPTFGMEYFLSNQFSFGAEIQLKTSLNASDFDQIYVTILAPISVRFYLK